MRQRERERERSCDFCWGEGEFWGDRGGSVSETVCLTEKTENG